MASYRILTNDLWTNQEGNKECFLHIEVNDGKDVWGKAARISAVDVARVVANPDAIYDIAQEMADRAVISKPQEKIDAANRAIYDIEQKRLEAAQEEARVEQIKLDTAIELAKVVEK